MKLVENMLKALKEGVVFIEFEKKDGTLSGRRFTLSPKVAEELAQWEPTEGPDLSIVVRAWSLDDNGWRSVKPNLIHRWMPVWNTVEPRV